jgi:hypothetical protein
MVEGGAKRSQKQSKKSQRIRPPLALVQELPVSSLAPQKPQSADSDQRKGRVGSHIAEVGSAEPSALVGELVVGLRLRNARRERSRKDDDDRDDEKCGGAGSSRDHAVGG